ncbi:hypothetical protein LL965_16225 [Xanthomonas cassavae CFBP 4642]|uniref:Uncharacterized protein n=1 Tax=Xanthomonas cassavae CFBP 4642 TaxID=1219375 RepID=A0ABS8HKA9_9XANT|nr:hypothetical protein [Xanthomonas cassavae]MCC4621555.1 hypothetical protein [Xanthomonas cassavae CFBP 4642]
MRKVVWDGEQQRFVANGANVDGLSLDTDEPGYLQFRRDGQATMVFASEYEISRSAQALRLERSLNAPSSWRIARMPRRATFRAFMRWWSPADAADGPASAVRRHGVV